MKARQKGKQNKKFEFIFQTEKDIHKILEAARECGKKFFEKNPDIVEAWKKEFTDEE